MSVARRNEETTIVQEHRFGAIDIVVGDPGIIPKQSAIFNLEACDALRADHDNLAQTKDGGELRRSIRLLIVERFPYRSAGEFVVGNHRLSTCSARLYDYLAIHDERRSRHAPMHILGVILLPDRAVPLDLTRVRR